MIHFIKAVEKLTLFLKTHHHLPPVSGPTRLIIKVFRQTSQLISISYAAIKLHRIFNRNAVKFNYRYMNNIQQLID